MMMTRLLFQRGLRIVFASGLGVTIATASSTAVSTVPSVTAVAEHMHRNHRGDEQQSNPVLRKPFHDVLLY